MREIDSRGDEVLSWDFSMPDKRLEALSAKGSVHNLSHI
jgi:hypothetical protein